MHNLKLSLVLIFLFCCFAGMQAQTVDTTRNVTNYSGSIGLTNNGFSIIPSFSLNSPAAIILLSWRKNRFSVDPDIRMTPDLKKGGMLFWLRYRAVERKKFSLRLGVHPALNFQVQTVTENGATYEITQMRRFIAGEVAPNYQFNSTFGIGMYYLTGYGLQKDGPVATHFIAFNAGIANLKLSKTFRFSVVPSVYYLYVDGFHGNYFTGTATLSDTRFPIALQAAVNKTLTSNLPGNQDFLWNVTVQYNFSRKLAKLAP